jgi:hypothetical protein
MKRLPVLLFIMPLIMQTSFALGQDEDASVFINTGFSMGNRISHNPEFAFTGGPGIQLFRVRQGRVYR